MAHWGDLEATGAATPSMCEGALSIDFAWLRCRGMLEAGRIAIFICLGGERTLAKILGMMCRSPRMGPVPRFAQGLFPRWILSCVAHPAVVEGSSTIFVKLRCSQA